jgi:hypothetical protein
LVSKTRFYHITSKSEKKSRIFCQTAEFYGGIGGKTSPMPGNSAEASFRVNRKSSLLRPPIHLLKENQGMSEVKKQHEIDSFVFYS